MTTTTELVNGHNDDDDDENDFHFHFKYPNLLLPQKNTMMMMMIMMDHTYIEFGNKKWKNFVVFYGHHYRLVIIIIILIWTFFLLSIVKNFFRNLKIVSKEYIFLIKIGIFLWKEFLLFVFFFVESSSTTATELSISINPSLLSPPLIQHCDKNIDALRVEGKKWCRYWLWLIDWPNIGWWDAKFQNYDHWSSIIMNLVWPEIGKKKKTIEFDWQINK